MFKRRFYVELIIVFGILAVFSCRKEESKTDCPTIPTYEGAVKVIIQENCAIAGCHDGGPFAPGNYTSFQGLNVVTSNGKFRRRVLEIKDMPLGIELSEDDFNTLKCWSEGGYPLQ